MKMEGLARALHVIVVYSEICQQVNLASTIREIVQASPTAL